jgi:YHS domain-containing protein
VIAMRMMRHLLVVAGAVTVLAAAHPLAAKPEWHLSRGLALGGYDAVAYFTESRAVTGDARFELPWKGARWRFASAEHRDQFRAKPEQYVPQFGGYCAWAVSRGYTASGDPHAWSVVDGRLYLNYSVSVRSQWEKDRAANIAKGTANWPAVLEQ